MTKERVTFTANNDIWSPAKGFISIDVAFQAEEQGEGILTDDGIIRTFSKQLGEYVSIDRNKVRIMEHCTVCKQPTEQGYIIAGDIHCSDECLVKTMPMKEYLEAHRGNSDDFYWTEWHGDEY